jgi:hypothetical protein
MSQLLWANNASSVTVGSIAYNVTSVTLSAGTGAEFPVPNAAYQYFLATLSPATPGAQDPEIVRVTAVSGDTFTIVRGQEGTSAQGWASGSIIQNLITKGTLNALSQMVVYAGNPNGNVAGATGVAGVPPSMVWDSTNSLIWVCTGSGNAATASWAAQAPLNSPAFTGNPTATTQTSTDNSTRLSTTAFVQGIAATKANLAGSAAQLFSVASAVSNANAVNLGQFPATLISTPGSATLPSGLIIKWGVFNIVNGPNTVTFNAPFPNACFQVVVCEGAANNPTWGSGLPTIHAVSARNPADYTGWALYWNGTEWRDDSPGGITQSYIAVGW